MGVNEVPRSHVLLSVLAVAAIAFLGARALRPPTLPDASGTGAGVSATAGQRAPVVTREQGGRVVVHVAGAVRRAGVYRLREGQRVADALQRAGGAGKRADLDAVNLAAKVTDGQQVLVPARGATGTAGGADAAAPGAPDVPLNLNTATLEQLDTLDGVGPATARKILEERTRRGGFRSVDELGGVPGIGPKRLAAIRPRVRV